MYGLTPDELIGPPTMLPRPLFPSLFVCSSSRTCSLNHLGSFLKPSTGVGGGSSSGEAASPPLSVLGEG